MKNLVNKENIINLKNNYEKTMKKYKNHLKFKFIKFLKIFIINL